MRRPVILLLCLTLLFSALGTACTTIPQTHYYLLRSGLKSDQTTRPTAGPRQGLRIGIKDFFVDPPYDQDQIVYRLGSEGVEVGFYTYHRWATPLSQMLPDLVADSFRGTPGIRSIETILTGRSYTAILEGRLMSLEEIDSPEGQQIDVKIALWLRLPDDSLIWSDVLHRRVLITSDTDRVKRIVEEMRAALIRVLSARRESLASALLKIP